MAEDKIPVTAAVRLLRARKISFVPCFYDYEERGGTEVSSRELGVNEHQVIKTLIMQDENKNPLIVLMHGDRQVSTKNLARLMSVKTIQPCEPDVANRHSGYVVGGTSPFATRKAMPVYMQRTIADLSEIWINGGKRGFLIKISPQDLIALLAPKLVEMEA